MYNINTKLIVGLVVLLSVAGFALAADPALRGNDNQSTDLPAVCQNLQVQAGNKEFFRVYALGVQVYRWNGASWNFVEPVANLFADENYRGKVGFHYAGPTWESNSGSKVIARRLDGCVPDSTAIPWLLLETVSTDGPGIFRRVTYIQRLNTTGGLAPTNPGSFINEEKRVPYTAEYYFYRAEN